MMVAGSSLRLVSVRRTTTNCPLALTVVNSFSPMLLAALTDVTL
jgi:hypothetical protein